MTGKLRHRCRNLKCRRTLPEPADDLRVAFCDVGCWKQHHRKRCVVCEGEFQRRAETQLVCARRQCRAELARHPELYRPFHCGSRTNGGSEAVLATTPPNVVNPPSEVPDLQGSKPVIEGDRPPVIRSLRGWVWKHMGRVDGDWELHNRLGRIVARIQQEGDGYWMARPRAWPEPPVEGRDAAMRRGELTALWGLPDPRKTQQAGQHPMGLPQSPSTAVSTSICPLTGDGSSMPDIPTFLRRATALVPA